MKLIRNLVIACIIICGANSKAFALLTISTNEVRNSITLADTNGGDLIVDSGSSLTVNGSIGTSGSQLTSIRSQGSGNTINASNIYVNGDFNHSATFAGGGNALIVNENIEVNDFTNTNVDSQKNTVTIKGKITADNFYNHSYDGSEGHIATINNADIGDFYNSKYSDTANISTTKIQGTLTADNFYNSGGTIPSLNGSGDGGILEFDGGKIVGDGGEVRIGKSSKIILNAHANNVYNIVETINGGTIFYDENTTTIVNNSPLFDTEIEHLTTEQILRVTQTLKSSTTSNYDATQKESIDNIFNISSTEGSQMAELQKKLRGISDAESLKKAVNSASLPRNNMAANAANEISNKSSGIISSRIFSSNFGATLSGFSSGNNQKSFPYGIWGQIFGGKASQDAKESQDGYDTKTAGFIFGADTIIKNSNLDHTIGAAISYGNSTVDSSGDSDQSVKINSYGLSLYNQNINSNNLGFYNQNIVNYSYDDYNSSRSVFGVATVGADYKGSQYGIKTGFGYNSDILENTLLSPNISIQYSKLTQDGYQEEGDLGQIVDQSQLETLIANIGIKAIYKIKTRGHSILPELETSWSRNLKDDGQTFNARYANGGENIAVTGVSLSQNIFNISLGISIISDKNAGNSLYIKYDRQQGSGYSSDSAFIKYRMEF